MPKTETEDMFEMANLDPDTTGPSAGSRRWRGDCAPSCSNGREAPSTRGSNGSASGVKHTMTDRALDRPSSRLCSMVSGYEMKLQETDEMAYPRKYVEHIFLGLEDPLNQHLDQIGRL